MEYGKNIFLYMMIISMAANGSQIKAACPQYEAEMLLNRQTMIRSTHIQLPQQVAFNLFVIGSVLPQTSLRSDKPFFEIIF